MLGNVRGMILSRRGYVGKWTVVYCNTTEFGKDHRR